MIGLPSELTCMMLQLVLFLAWSFNIFACMIMFSAFYHFSAGFATKMFSAGFCNQNLGSEFLKNVLCSLLQFLSLFLPLFIVCFLFLLFFCIFLLSHIK